MRHTQTQMSRSDPPTETASRAGPHRRVDAELRKRRGGGVAIAISVVVSLGCASPDRDPTVPVAPDSTLTGPVLPPLPQPSSFDVAIAVDSRALNQTMEGFGTTVRLFNDPHLIGASGGMGNGLDIGAASQDEILRRLYEDIGLTRIRAAVQSPGVEPVNDNDDPAVTDVSRFRFEWVFSDGHIDLLKRARAMGVSTWWLSPGALETWMGEASVEEYVEWTMTVLRYWRAKGVEPPFHSIVNEPNHPRVNVSGEFIRDVVKLLGPRLRAEGFATKLVIPDDVHPYHAVVSARPTLEDPEARQYIAALAFHLYDHPVDAAAQMRPLAEQFGLPLWMSEFAVAGDFLEWAIIMHRLIAEHNVSAVDYMWGFFGFYDKNQLLRVDHSGTQYQGYAPLPPFFAMGQYSKYVRPGARRIGAVSSDRSVMASAFLRDGRVTIVVINERDSVTRARVTIAGVAAPRSVSLVRTSATENMLGIGRIDLSGDAYTVELPARSISTFVQ